MKLSSGRLIVTKKLCKTQAEVIKETKIGDIVEFVTDFSPAYGMVNDVTFYNHTQGLSVKRNQTIAAKNMRSFEYLLSSPNEEELAQMREDIEFLECLKAAGVDNWEGYGDAWEMMNEEEE